MRRVAILIGTCNYDDGALEDLRSPRADVDAIERALKANGEFDEIVPLLEPTRGEASQAIEAALTTGKPDDLILISFSGHGVLDRYGRLHLTFRDTRQNSPLSTGLSSEALQRMLQDSRVTSKVLLLDCCYSGSFADGFTTRSGQDTDTINFQREFLEERGEGTYVIASSGANQPAHEGANAAGAHPSPFSDAVARGLSGEAEDTDGTGWIDWESLHRFVRREVERDGRQRVTGFALGAVGRVNLARHVESATAVSAHGSRTPPSGSAEKGADRTRGERVAPGAEGSAHAGSSESGPRGDPDADFGLRRWTSLFTYYRACLSRQSVLQQLPDAKATKGARHAACGMGKERLLSGTDERWRLTGDAERLVRSAAASHQALRYGYPAVVFDAAARRRGKRSEWKVAPLFVMDVEAVQEDDGLYLLPVGEIELNAELAASVADLDPPDLEELTTWFKADWASESLSKLGDKARSVCKVLDLECVNALEPGRLRDRLDLAVPLRTGAQNVALLHVADLAARAVKQLIGDLDAPSENAMKPDRIDGTALAALSGRAEARPPQQPFTPVITGLSNTSQEEILASAMTRRLTVATGAAGTGKSELITSVVTSAVTAGQSVLIASTNNTAVDEVVRRANKLLDDADLIVRTGNAEERQRERGILSDLRAAQFDRIDVRTLAEKLKVHERQLGEIRSGLADIAGAEHHLAVLAPDREREIADLPGGLTPETFRDIDTVRAWGQRVGKALESRWTRWWHRWRIRRGLGVVPEEPGLVALLRFLATERSWRAVHGRLASHPDPAELYRAAKAIRDGRRADSAQFVVGQVAAALQSGQDHIDNRLQALAEDKSWKGIPALVRTVRAWATTSRSVRGVLPPNPGLFDLVVIDEASQCTVADLIPLLYRAKRALVIGDPHQLQPVHTLDPAEDQRAQRLAGIAERWLDERSLIYSRSSAYHAAAAALARAGGQVLWLDEHYRCHPDIVAPANRRFYGNRLAIRTNTQKLKEPIDPAVQWIDVRGEPERPEGGSCRNRMEADAVIEQLRELWALPSSTSIGVVSPFTAQCRLVENRLGPKGTDRIRVGTVHTFQGGECDVIVVSPAAATGVDRRSGNWAVSQQNLWNVAITRARSRLYIVGDRGYWSERDGVLTDIARQTAAVDGPLLPDDTARESLFSALQKRGASPTVGRRLNGYTCDLSVPTGDGETAVFIDWAGTDQGAAGDLGRVLYRTLDRVALFEAVTGVPALRVPAWRCLSDPDSVASELLAP
ncbi:hypothetical protein GCM10009799_28130 [Nocardiopsis rhodophaea]|uniref:Caspase domain-containing protein n=1 Tax=Nocardiopsis rhodophaea TaxID=280238 RepID=A0ABN2T5Y2_9ACTN